MQNIFTNIKCSEIILSNANENWYIILTTCFHSFAILRHMDPFVRMLHIYRLQHDQQLEYQIYY